jgi:geranylgeranyl pyrophosphate synthase
LEELIQQFINQIEPIWQVIEHCTSDTGASSEYIQVIRRALLKGYQNAPGVDDMRFALLPGICSQSAGGEASWANNLAAAWFLFYCAADIMDSIEDQDPIEPWWADGGYPVMLSAASGCFFTATRCLNQIYDHPQTCAHANIIIEDFLKGFMVMCNGQYRDLILLTPSLSQFWEITAEKSGIFFSLACKTGARLATQDPNILELYSKFGHHLGLYIQIMDDLKEYQMTQDKLLNNYSNTRRSLPVVYAMEFIQPELRLRLDSCLHNASHQEEAAVEAREVIENAGAVLYLSTEIVRQQSMALEYLSAAKPLSPGRETLENLFLSL